MGILSRLNYVPIRVQTGVVGRGSLRIYLGAAVGVGKTYAMLSEGRRRRARGTDVVVGYVETHGRAATADQIGNLEVVPPLAWGESDDLPEEMDLDAILARRPQVALVDDLAHANAPGARNRSRWQDVLEMLDAGIDVVSTLNICQLESLVDVAEAITGIAQPETVPDEVVAKATQVELVDLTPEALRRRLAHGNIYPPGSVDAALTNYFRLESLAALRELTIQWMADRVDAGGHARADGRRAVAWETRERIVVGVSGAPGTERLIRRAARIAHRARGELVGVHIRAATPASGSGHADLARYRVLLAELGGRFDEVTGSDVATALMDFARSEHATQIVLGATHRSRWTRFREGPVVNHVLRSAGPIDVHVVSHDRSTAKDGTHPVWERKDTGRRAGALPPRLTAGVVEALRRRSSLLPSTRRTAAWLLVLLGLPLLTFVLAQLRDSVTLSSDLLVYLLFVVIVAATGGATAALISAVAATFLVNWFFTPPIHTWTIARGSDVLALTVYLGTAAIVSTLVSIAAHRSAEASRANLEARTLAAVASGVVEADPLPELMVHLRQVFGLAGVSLLRLEDGRWITETTAGQAPSSPDQADETHDLGDGLVLALSGAGLGAHDRLVLNAFTAHLAAALDRRHLQAQAAEASALAETSELRSSLLQAVSHDLRTPLASIKASVSSLRQGDITWTAAESSEFLATIEEETDRLTNLVGNLLDMSRVNANAVTAILSPTALDAVVAGALAGLGTRAKTVDVDVPESTPPVNTDPALLERVIANLVDNALIYAPESPVRVDAGCVGDRVLLRVIDYGPGIPASQRDLVFQSFQRLDDSARPNGSGVGLGLAVARGFAQAIGADLSIEDTPGGGVTMIIVLPAADTQVLQ
ncbi:MAG TPA: ATP-binding protein [Acidimicrobiales bacterium]|nr:ATP-binding protein [Acidimicrobiales bacterium]